MSPLVNNIETLGMSHSLTLMKISVSHDGRVFYLEMNGLTIWVIL